VAAKAHHSASVTTPTCEFFCRGSDAAFGLMLLLVAVGLLVLLGLALWSRHRLRTTGSPYLGPRSHRAAADGEQTPISDDPVEASPASTHSRMEWLTRHAWLVLILISIATVVVLQLLPSGGS
jgi:uncharacterized membrane protein